MLFLLYKSFHINVLTSDGLEGIDLFLLDCVLFFKVGFFFLGLYLVSMAFHYLLAGLPWKWQQRSWLVSF